MKRDFAYMSERFANNRFAKYNHIKIIFILHRTRVELVSEWHFDSFLQTFQHYYASKTV